MSRNDRPSTALGGLDPAVWARLAHCLNYYDCGSPTEADVEALWRAYKSQAARLAAVELELSGYKDLAEGAV